MPCCLARPSGFMLAGLSLPAMSLGGILAGIAVALVSGLVSRYTPQKEDASFAAFFMISLALGVLLVSTHGSTVDLMHVLFGTILAVDDLRCCWWPRWPRSAAGFRRHLPPAGGRMFRSRLSALRRRTGRAVHTLFLVLVVLNMVSGFQALGTLMAVGLMMLPAAAARFWVRQVWSLAGLSVLIWPLPRAMPGWCCLTASICRPARPSSCWPERSTSSRSFSVGMGGLVDRLRPNSTCKPDALPSARSLFPLHPTERSKPMIRKIAAAAGVLALVAAVPASAKEVKAVASFTVLADMVQQVGGGHVHVSSLVGPNGDPHVYEPTPSDADALAQADLVFVSGLGLEGWLDRLISASGTKGKTIVASNGIARVPWWMTTTARPKVRPSTDPHAWNSAANAVIYATNIEKALIDADPEDAADIKASGDRYIARTARPSTPGRTGNRLSAEGQAQGHHQPRRLLLHGGRLRDLVPGAPGHLDGSRPTAAQVAALIKQIRAEKVKVVSSKTRPIRAWSSRWLMKAAPRSAASFIRKLCPPPTAPRPPISMPSPTTSKP